MYNKCIYDTITKTVVKRVSRRRNRGRFLTAQARQEGRYKKDLILYLSNQERRVMSILGASKGIKTDDPTIKLQGIWVEETNLLIETSIPHMESSLKAGSKLAAQEVSGNIMYDHEIADALFARQNRIVKVSNRLYNQIKMEIHAGMAEGESLNQIAKRIQTYYKTSDSDALRIARTETSSAMSKATQETYKKNGIDKKVWLATGDDRTRDTHMANQAQGPIPMDAAFGGTGEQHPGESEINCRCSLAAHIE